MSRVHIHIERLVLPAMEPADRRAFVESLQKELQRTFAGFTPPAGGAKSRRTPVLRLAGIPLRPGGGGDCGGALARSIGKALPR